MSGDKSSVIALGPMRALAVAPARQLIIPVLMQVQGPE